MLGPWTPLAGFLVGFLLVFLLIRWINSHMQGLFFLLGADEDSIIYLQFALFFPGIFIHELSHWLVATLSGVRTLGFSVWPEKKGKGRVQYGSVRIVQTDFVRSSLIGLAPLVGASLLIIVIGRYALGTETLRLVVASGNWGGLWSAVSGAARAPDFWLWFYLIFAISNAMFPSQSDRESWKPLIIYATIAGVLVYLSGWKPAFQSVPTILAQVTNPLIYAFGITAAVDLFFAVVIGILEIVVGRIRGKRVRYGK